jgi:hypothetical protein
MIVRIQFNLIAIGQAKIWAECNLQMNGRDDRS